MRRFTIKTKLILGISIILVLTVIVATYANFIEKKMMDKHNIANNYLEDTNVLKEYKESYLNWIINLKDVLLFNLPFKGELDYTKCEFSRWYYTYIESDNFKNSLPSYKQVILKMEEHHRNLHISTEEVLNKWNEGKHEEAKMLFETVTAQTIDDFLNLINTADMSLLDKTTSSLAEADALMSDSVNGHNLGMIISLLLSIVIVIFLIRTTVTPVSKFIQRIQEMNKSEIYKTIDDIHTNDEINDLINVFNRMVNKVNNQQIELQEQNEELIAQGEELTAQNEEILEQQKELQDTLLKLTKQDELVNRLYKFSQTLNHTINVEELMNSALNGLQEEANAQVGAFMLYDEDNDELKIKLSYGLIEDEYQPTLKLGTGLAGRAAIQRKVLIANYGDSELRSQGLYGKLSMVSEMYLPLIVQGRLLGVVILGRLHTTPFENNETRLLTALCDQIAVALDNALTHMETQKALNKVQEVDKLKSEMINTVSHELRTPLSSILGFSELLLAKEVSADKSKKYLSTIHSEAERLKDLINDFLDLQKIENGKLEVVKKQVNLVALIKNSMDIYQGHSKHSIGLDIDQELPFIFTDPDRLQQVIGNLLSNAIKYSPQGGKIELKAYQNSPGWITISVKDEGLGIPEEAQKNLFQPFFRVDNSDRRQIGGTGLGLAISRKIVQALGGDIWVNSVHGKGSAFMFTLPITEDTVVISEEQVENTQEMKQLKNLILLIEDDKAMGDLISESLLDAGFRAVVFNNGAKALDFAKSELPTVIILDLILAGPLDGWEVLKRLKLDDKTKDIPIIISSCIDQKERVKEHKIVDYLVKPFAPVELVNSIRSIVQKPS